MISDVTLHYVVGQAYSRRMAAKRAMNMESIDQNQRVLRGMRRMAKKLAVWTAEVKQNVAAYASKLPKSTSMDMPQVIPRRFIRLLKVRTLILPE